MIKKSSIALLAALAFFSSCEKDTEPTNFAPTMTTGNAEDIYRLGATIKGSVQNPNGYTLNEYGIQYSLYQSFAEPVLAVAPEGSTPQDFSVSVADLSPGTSYFYRTYAFSGYSTVYGESRSFSTASTNAPVFGATTTSNITLTSFDVTAELIDNGGSELMMSGFVYKPVTNENDDDLTTNTTGAVLLTCDATFKATVRDLYTGTLYAIRPYGVSNGLGYGKIAYVRTEETDQAMLSSCTLSDSTLNSIRVEAHLLSAGTHPIVEAGFCYSSENNAPTISNLHTTVPIENNVFSSVIEGLDSDTKYYIRAYVKDENGTPTYGEVKEYTVMKHEVLEVSTVTVDEITVTSARLWGNVRANNVEIGERGFCWSSTNSEPTLETSDKLPVNTEEVNFSTTVNIQYGYTYYYRAYATNSKGEVFYGDVLTFTSQEIERPIVVANIAKDITEASVTLGGKVVSNGGGTIYKMGVCLSSSNQTPNLVSDIVYQFETEEENFKENQSYEKSIDGLTHNTQYYYRVYAYNEKGTSYSEVQTFTTSLVIGPVVIGEVTVSNITQQSVTATATITSNGNGTIIEKGFCYVEGTATPTINNQRISVPVDGSTQISTTISNLKANTTYTISAYAQNESGVAYSSPSTVTTTKNNPAIDDAVFPNL